MNISHVYLISGQIWVAAALSADGSIGPIWFWLMAALCATLWYLAVKSHKTKGT